MGVRYRILKEGVMHTHVFKLDPPTEATSMGYCDCGESKLHVNRFTFYDERHRASSMKGVRASAKAKKDKAPLRGS